MALSPKTRLGAYEILGPLGAGGMGEVYRAKDLRLGRDVAVKVLPQAVASSPERRARFEREARTVAGLNHPNIVTLHSVEDEEGIRFLTMELVDGQTLSNLLVPGGLPLAEILELSIPLADALVAAHERGVIHRDLKPSNVMVTRERRVKVLDFGLAKMAGVEERDRDETLTATAESLIPGEGRMLGTVPYMAPEQVRGEAVDARSDLFALGIILFELATGRRPFTGETSIDVSHAILRDAPEPLARLRSGLPADFERIVSRCLQKNPRQRFQTALDVSNELRAIRRGMERGGSENPAPEKVASIAVLPFVNRSASADDEYFSDGLADELLNVLARIRGLRVVARTSSFQFKSTQDDIATIGRKLDVSTILEGSVRKAGNRIRVSVQLVKVSDSSHLWSDSYDRTLDDIFAVQDDIAQSVVKELRATLLGQDADSDASGRAKAEVAKAARGRGSDTEAHRLFLLARHFLNRGTREDNSRGIESLREALERDGAFALAWVELAQAYLKEADMGWAPVADGYRRAREAVDRALAAEPDLADAHAIQGRMRMLHERDWRGAETSHARALELEPGNALALRGAGALAMNRGRLEEAVALTRRSLERDPLSVPAYMSLGMSLLAAGRFTEAEEAYRRALELAPQRVATSAHLALALLACGRTDEALGSAKREPHDGFRLWALAIVHHGMGHESESTEALRELTEKFADDGPFQIAEAHGARGDVDAAFDWLERAYASRDGGLAETQSSPRLSSLHDDARWGAFLRRAGFAE